MERLMTRLAGLALLALFLALPGSAHAATCKPPKYPGSGYFTTLKVSHVSCTTGRSVALSFHKCRTRTSIKGYCHSRVRGYRCTETRQSSAIEYDSRVTCRDGGRRVEFTYQQNT